MSTIHVALLNTLDTQHLHHDLNDLSWVRINRDYEVCHFFLDKFLVLKFIHLNIPKLVLYFTHYLISIKFEVDDEIMDNVQHQFREVKMDLKTRNSSRSKVRISANTGPGFVFTSYFQNHYDFSISTPWFLFPIYRSHK